jgi:hypothetical protein
MLPPLFAISFLCNKFYVLPTIKYLTVILLSLKIIVKIDSIGPVKNLKINKIKKICLETISFMKPEHMRNSPLVH